MEGPNIPVCVELANAIGLNEAMLLQQIHYWCCISKEKKFYFEDGHYWAKNTYEGWTQQLPWKGRKTTERVVENLETKGLIIIGNYSRGAENRTKWYRVNYDRLAEITSSFCTAKVTNPVDIFVYTPEKIV